MVRNLMPRTLMPRTLMVRIDDGSDRLRPLSGATVFLLVSCSFGYLGSIRKNPDRLNRLDHATDPEC